MNDQADTTLHIPFRNLPALCASTSREAPRGRGAQAEPGFAAQVLGAGGQRRGLKGGAPVLQAARRAYLETEWSGGGDRRAEPGRLALTRI